MPTEVRSTNHLSCLWLFFFSFLFFFFSCLFFFFFSCLFFDFFLCKIKIVKWVMYIEPQIYSTYVLLTQIAGQELHVEAGLLLCAAGQELIPLAGKHSLPPLIATSFWPFVAKLFIVHSF